MHSIMFSIPWENLGYFPSLGKGELYCRRRFYRHRFSIQEIRPIFPLFNGINGRWRQHGISHDQIYRFNIARAADHNLEYDGSLNSCGPRVGRILRLNFSFN